MALPSYQWRCVSIELSLLGPFLLATHASGAKSFFALVSQLPSPAEGFFPRRNHTDGYILNRLCSRSWSSAREMTSSVSAFRPVTCTPSAIQSFTNTLISASTTAARSCIGQRTALLSLPTATGVHRYGDSFLHQLFHEITSYNVGCTTHFARQESCYSLNLSYSSGAWPEKPMLTPCNSLGTSRLPVKTGEIHYSHFGESGTGYASEILDLDSAATTHQRAQPKCSSGHYPPWNHLKTCHLADLGCLSMSDRCQNPGPCMAVQRSRRSTRRWISQRFVPSGHLRTAFRCHALLLRSLDSLQRPCEAQTSHARQPTTSGKVFRSFPLPTSQPATRLSANPIQVEPNDPSVRTPPFRSCRSNAKSSRSSHWPLPQSENVDTAQSRTEPPDRIQPRT